jgi:hypothetical protein
MSYSYASAVTGVVTQAATAATINIPVPGFGDLLKFEIWDETQFGLASANTDMLQAYWFKDMPAGSAFVKNRVSGSAAAITTNMVTTNGFTLIDPTASQLQGAKTGTAITAADPAVVTLNSHGYSVGDTVLLTNTTGMLQIAGYAFTITAVSTNTFTLGYLDASGFAAAATNVVARKVNFLSPYVPRRARITNVGTATALGVAGAGTSSIITLAETNIFTVGQAVRIYVPTSFISAGSDPFAQPGIIGTNNTLQQIVTATVTAINTADNSSPAISNTITVNINSTGTTFAFPTSAVAATGVQQPFVEPVGEAATTMAGTVNPQNLLDDRTQNTGNFIMQLGSNVYGVANDVIRWFAWRGVVQS